jgi:DNA polymerase-3 subunit delta'
MLKFSEIFGHKKEIKVLQSAIVSGEIAHAYLFYGPEGLGKKSVAFAFAQALFCKEKPEEGVEACGHCSNCRRVEGGNFPDFHYLFPTIHEKKKKKEIIIGDIRTLIGRLSYRPYEGGRKVVIVDNTDQLQVQAANAFLKTLEEPPPDTIIILVASNRRKLLPTIISRCQEVRFNRLPVDHMIGFVKERLSLPEEEAMTLAALSRGAPGAALAGSLEKDKAIRDNAWRLIVADQADYAAEVFSIASLLDRQKDKTDTGKTIEAVTDLLRDLLTVKIAGKCDKLFNIDLQSEMVRTANKFSRRRLLRGYEAACKMAEARLWNISPLLVINLLALELRK